MGKFIVKQHIWVAIRKRKLNAEKKINIINGVSHRTRTGPFAFEDSQRIIKSWNCADDYLFSSNKTQHGL